MASELSGTGGCMSFLYFIKYSHPYFLWIVPTTPTALFLLRILLLYILATFKNPLYVHVLRF